MDIGYEDMMFCDGYVYYVADCYANDQMYLFRGDEVVDVVEIACRGALR